mmetsp:Transcript_14799/g.51576  ORF Transcript_14799/g.51576 Transcript_14799/m.51576 type:complete len:235 (-) Transcript_14799:48-752(-)
MQKTLYTVREPKSVQSRSVSIRNTRVANFFRLPAILFVPAATLESKNACAPSRSTCSSRWRWRGATAWRQLGTATWIGFENTALSTDAIANARGFGAAGTEASLGTDAPEVPPPPAPALAPATCAPDGIPAPSRCCGSLSRPSDSTRRRFAGAGTASPPPSSPVILITRAMWRRGAPSKSRHTRTARSADRDTRAGQKASARTRRRLPIAVSPRAAPQVPRCARAPTTKVKRPR